MIALVVVFVVWSGFQGAGLFFAVFLWPLYLVVFSVLGGLEYVLRKRGVLPSLPATRSHTER
jgi:hypothetical protein